MRAVHAKAGKYLIIRSFLDNFRSLGITSQSCALSHVGRDAISQCGYNNHTTQNGVTTMKSAISLIACAFLLGGCLETTSNDEKKDETEILEINVDPVAPMLLNSIGGLSQDYWTCTAASGDFESVFLEDGTGLYFEGETGNILNVSAQTSPFSWSENPNGVIRLQIESSESLVELQKFNFSSMFEFTVDSYEDGVFNEQNRCELIQLEVSPPLPELEADDFVTAANLQAEDAGRFFWGCVVENERVAFIFFADATGIFVFNDENGEAGVLQIADWQLNASTIEARAVTDTGGSVNLQLGNIQNGEGSFTADLTIATDSLGSTSCQLTES